MRRKVLFFLSFVMCLFCIVLIRAQADDNTAPPANETGQEKYAGMKECVSCHAKKFYESYLNSPHGQANDPRTPAAQHQCESCHGPGGEHARAEAEAENGPITILGPKAPTPIKEQNKICLECHSTSKLHLFWKGSKHEQRGLGCVNCHQVHGGNWKLLEGSDEIATCTQCHLDIKAQIQMPYHHPIREGSLICTDCHNPHGSFGPKLLTANDVNEKCFQCHADKRGPFLWEHPPAAENCLNCHTPHGSAHDFLLTERLPWLCQRCHDGEGHQGILYTQNMFSPNPGTSTVQSVYSLRPQLYNRGCWQCHVAIHGSNSASGQSLLR